MNLVNAVSSVIPHVFTWIGEVLSHLLFLAPIYEEWWELSYLFVIPISISVIFVTIKFIKRFVWGN